MIKEYYRRIRLVAIHMDICSKVLSKMNQCKYLKRLMIIITSKIFKKIDDNK